MFGSPKGFYLLEPSGDQPKGNKYGDIGLNKPCLARPINN